MIKFFMPVVGILLELPEVKIVVITSHCFFVVILVIKIKNLDLLVICVSQY